MRSGWEVIEMILFCSEHAPNRAENLRAVFDAYCGPKTWGRGYSVINDAPQRGYAVAVTDTMMPWIPEKLSMPLVFVGHGITGGKSYAFDQPVEYLDRRSAGQVDFAVCASTHTRGIVARQLRIDVERVLPLGMPRTDGLVGKLKGDGGTVLPGAARSYLYAPTFRDGYERAPLPVIDWARLDSMMEDDELMVVKRHYYTEQPLLDGECRHIVESGNMEPSTPYLIDCDVLLTDFSSIVFDAYVAGKPAVLATDFSDGYLAERGMYFEYPGGYGSRHLDIQGNEAAMLATLRQAAAEGMDAHELAIRDYTADMCDGQSARRVAELIERLEMYQTVQTGQRLEDA